MLDRLISIETFKLQRRLFLILPLCIFVYLGLTSIFQIELLRSRTHDVFYNDSSEFPTFMLSFFRSLTIPIAIFVLYQIGHEFENCIVQKNISLGFTRKNYFFSKIIYSGFITLFYLILFLTFVFLYKYQFHYFSTIEIREIMIASAGVVLTVISFCMFFILFIFLFKEVKKAILLFIAYLVGELVLVNIVKRYYDIEFPIPMPFTSIKSILLDGDIYHYFWQNSTLGLIFIFIYPVAYGVISYYSFRKSDLPAL